MPQNIFDSLQELQLAFDQSHGMLGIGSPVRRSSHPRNAEAAVGEAQFAALALVGECGEIANAIKKAVRSIHFGGDPTPHMEIARNELADALAYLLKLASILSTDLRAEYLETLALNSLRFRLSPKENAPWILGIAGFDTSTVDKMAAHLTSGATPKATRNVNFQTSRQTDPQSLTAWLKDCRATLNAEFAAAPKAAVIVLSHDPAFEIHRLLTSGRQGMTGDSLIEMLGALVAFEQVGWHNATGRGLALVSERASSAAASDDESRVFGKLARYGAKVVEPRTGPLDNATSRQIFEAIWPRGLDPSQSASSD